MLEQAGVVHARRYMLGEDVEVIRRRESVLLFARTTQRSVRISPVAAELLPLLVSGSEMPQMLQRLQQSHPRSTDVATKLETFLDMLASTGMIRGQGGSGWQRRIAGKYPLFSPDALAAALAWPLLRLPQVVRRFLGGGLVVLAITAIAMLGVRGGLPPLRGMVEFLHWGGVVLFALVVVPVHELAHAVACRLGGVRVGAAGLLLHGGFLPGPYVDTSNAYSLRERWPRLVIPAAGPFVNLVAAGSVAGLLLWLPVTSLLVPWLHGALLFCLLFVYFDTNPLTPSDGSHCLEAWLDDELARRHALSLRPGHQADRRVVRRYRQAIAAHLLASAVLFWVWWQ